MKFKMLIGVLALCSTTIGCGASSDPTAQAITPAIATEIQAQDKQVEQAESAQGGADRRPTN